MRPRSFFQERRRPRSDLPRANRWLPRALGLLLGVGAVGLPCAAWAEPLVFEGTVPADDLEHFFVPFDVPAGTAEIEVRHSDESTSNILDWGLDDPDGFRGWGGGNDEPAIVGEFAASRSYLRGPVRPGRWKVVVGKAKLVTTPAKYRIEVELRTQATLPPQPDRKPYAEATPRASGTRYYAGDLHVHSEDSGDSDATLREDVDLAKRRGLDFIEVSDHNTVSQLDSFAKIQGEEPNFLLVPGIEYTTYHGHANAIGATTWVDHKIGQPGITLNGAVDALREQGAIFSINHPLFELGTLCIGCAWKYDDVDFTKVGGIEVGTVGGTAFSASSLTYWDHLVAKGYRLAALGGGDDHNAGRATGFPAAMLGSPTTLVRATELSVPALLEGIRKGATVVKFEGPDGPMIELELFHEASDSAPFAFVGDTVEAPTALVRATISGNVGGEVRLVKNGLSFATATVTSDPFLFEAPVEAPMTGEDRYRAEVVVRDAPVTITSHFWMRPSAPGSGASDDGCTVSHPSRSRRLGWLLAITTGLGLAAVARRRRS